MRRTGPGSIGKVGRGTYNMMNDKNLYGLCERVCEKKVSIWYNMCDII